MTSRPHNDPSHRYFLTATILGWRQILTDPACAQIVLDSLDCHRRQGRWSLCAYVLMPNHCHAIIKPGETQTVSTVLQSFGSFTAHKILDHLKSKGRHELLAFFAQRQEKDARKQHQIWQPIQAKNVYSVEFLREKLEYTHSNPVAKRWRMVEDQAEYAYSSACFYDRGLVPIVEVDLVRVWLV